MNRLNTLKISFLLKNTYRVNSILFSLKQIPLVRKALPDRLYQSAGLKILANVLSGLWEAATVFLGKFLYFLLMIAIPGSLYETLPYEGAFLHILFFLTVIGSYANTYMFNPTKDKYYAMILMRMDAKRYTLVNYAYAIVKTAVGFLVFGLYFGLRGGLSVRTCLLIPCMVIGMKLTVSAVSLLIYEKTGIAVNENKLGKLGFSLMFVFLAAAYGLPALGWLLPDPVFTAVGIFSVLGGIPAVIRLCRFDRYREMYQPMLAKTMSQMDEIKHISADMSARMISEDREIFSRKKGFEYLNELFVRRHQKILWRSVRRLSVVCLVLFAVLTGVFLLYPEDNAQMNQMLLEFLPYFVFIMYSVNRGTGFTKALFMNCDRSLLTYSFYKQPRFVLKLFQIRLREIVKINLLPAAVIGTGLNVILYVTGGTDPLNYGILFVSIVSMSIFFSVHYLTIYYLLQPYNAGTEMKSGTYGIILGLTYLVCFAMLYLRMPIMMFGLMCIAFCLLYSAAACILIYRFAPKTFRLRM